MCPDTYIICENAEFLHFFKSIYKTRIKFVEFNYHKIYKLIITILKIYYFKKIEKFDNNIIDLGLNFPSVWSATGQIVEHVLQL